MSTIKRITREEEANIPEFSNYGEARDWFANKYGDAFVLAGTDDSYDGGTVFTFHLILDRSVYEDGGKKLSAGETIHGMEFILSYQPIEIFEDGHIHIVH